MTLPSRYTSFSPIRPFGERSAQEEREVLGDSYESYFFQEAPFNKHALDPKCYLIVGRRGSGKSSLIEYFGFQNDFPRSELISISKPNLYSALLEDFDRKLNYPPEILIPFLVDIWKVILWSLIFDKFKDDDPILARAIYLPGKKRTSSELVFDLLSAAAERFLVGGGDFLRRVRDHLRDEQFVKAQDKALAIVAGRPIIIAIDSMEHYSISHNGLMSGAAALVQAAADFNLRYSRAGIHIKIFVAGEVYPYLVEDFLLNPAKHLRDELWLHWKPKDLVRLVCYRLNLFLDLWPNELGSSVGAVENWNDFREVEEKIWIPCFGRTLTNRMGVVERTFPYVLRHTQLRPRQMVIMCNQIARVAGKAFPRIPEGKLVDGVREAELILASEVINSYKQIYPHIGDVVSALSGTEISFKGNFLDKVAKRSSSSWQGEYSLARFRRLVAEIGVVGRVRAADDFSGIVASDFEFTLRDRLFINEMDHCVIHPMFYRKLNTKGKQGRYVYPFPDHPDFAHVSPVGRR